MSITPSVIDNFSAAAKSYDEKNLSLAPITDTLHFLIRLILKNSPAHARVLCVGVGTGAEILSLAQAFPEWEFVGVEPSVGMLDVCRKRLSDAGVIHRCTLIQGYADDVPPGENFDVALSILVAHFVKREMRLDFYSAMSNRLRQNGILIHAEISYDLNSPEFPFMLKNWATVQSLMGASKESIDNLPAVLREGLSVISLADTEHFLKLSGINVPVRFFQSFMINGWYGYKNSQSV